MLRPGPIYGARDRKWTARLLRTVARPVAFVPTVGVPAVHAGDVALAAATALANEIIECAPLTVAAAKEMVYMAHEMGVGAATRAGAHIFDRVYRAADALEGPLAFKEKRKPNWKGV